jgi:class 3 adenylate cyclase
MLPRGTVTFLLTDIEDNPRLSIQHPHAMHDLISHYAAILQQAITGAGGDIVKINGDVVGAAFANPLDAITAALATHRALGAESWGAIGPLPVRMVVHTGVVAEPTDGFVGEPTNWAMQLLAASHGHQLLLSQVTQELLRDQLLAGIALHDLGTYCLGNRNSPEHLFQLIVPDLPAAFPPLRPPARRPHNLTVPPTR